MKRLSVLILFACALSMGAHAQIILPSSTPDADSLAFAKVRARMDSIRQYRPTVGLVLAGGGARGLAHLGVIKYMEELGIPVDVITGTSMGGLVGGLYALGYRHDELDSLVRDINWPVMMSDQVPDDYVSYRLRKYREKYVIRIPHHYEDEDLADRIRKQNLADKMASEANLRSADIMQESINKMGLGMPDGFLYGLNVRNMLSSVSVGYQDSLSFAELPIPYACVATDLYALTPKYWTSGSITDAMRSTMAIPFYFRAVRENGEILLDGGMRNNFPVDLARAMGADIVIGSDMSIHRELNELNSPADFLMQTITLLASTTAGPAMEMLDLDVHHELKGYNMLSFDDKSVDDIIDQGYQNAIAHRELFESIAAVVAGKGTPPVSHPVPAVNLAQHKVSVGAIEFRGISDKDRSAILHPRDFPNDTLFDRATVERLLNRVYGSNAFESVTYHLEGREAPYTLVFDCQKGQVNDFAVGIRADTDETVAVALHYGLGTRRLSGPRLTADLKLGTNPSLTVDYALKSRIGLPTVGVVARSNLMNTQYGWQGDSHYSLFGAAVDAYMEDSRFRRGAVRLGVTAEMTPYEHHLSNGGLRLGWDWKSYWLSGFATLKFDTLDDGYFPTRGVRFTLDGRYVFNGKSMNLMYNDMYDDMYSDKGDIWNDGDDNGPEDVGSYDGAGGPDGREEDGSGPDVPAGYFDPTPVRPYGSAVASFQAAFSIGENFTILPSIYLGWNSTFNSYMHPRHGVVVGGFLPGRYAERQIPFFGFSNGFRSTAKLTVVPQLDLRYRFARKNFVTLRGGCFLRDDSFEGFADIDPVYAFGGEYGRQTMVGPLKVAVQWCDITGVTFYASIGFEF